MGGCHLELWETVTDISYHFTEQTADQLMDNENDC